MRFHNPHWSGIASPRGQPGPAGRGVPAAPHARALLAAAWLKGVPACLPPPGGLRWARHSSVWSTLSPAPGLLRSAHRDHSGVSLSEGKEVGGQVASRLGPWAGRGPGRSEGGGLGPISTAQTGLSTRGQARGDNVSTGLLLQGWGDRPPRKVHVAISTSGHAPAAPLGCVWPAARAGAGRGPRAPSGGCCSHVGITQMTEPTETRTPRRSPRGLEGWGRGAPKDSPAFDPYPCALWSSCWRRWHLGRPGVRWNPD